MYIIYMDGSHPSHHLLYFIVNLLLLFFSTNLLLDKSVDFNLLHTVMWPQSKMSSPFQFSLISYKCYSTRFKYLYIRLKTRWDDQMISVKKKSLWATKRWPLAELLTSHLGRVPRRVMSHEGRVESLRSVLESSQVTSHRGLESSRITQSCRVMPESDIIFNIH